MNGTGFIHGLMVGLVIAAVAMMYVVRSDSKIRSKIHRKCRVVVYGENYKAGDYNSCVINSLKANDLWKLKK